MLKPIAPALLLSIAAAVLVSAAPAPAAASAAAAEAVEKERPNSLRSGSWSIQFEITDKLGLIPFDNLAGSFKRHLTRKTALRFGFDLDWSIRDAKEETEEIDARYPDMQETGSVDTEQSSHYAAFKPAWLLYLNPGSTYNLYLGAGPMVSFTRTRTETVRSSVLADQVTTRKEFRYDRTWGFGFLCLGGVEWFVTESIGLLGECRASAAFYRSYMERWQIYITGDNVRRYDATSDKDDWRFDGVEVLLGLSFYF